MYIMYVMLCTLSLICYIVIVKRQFREPSCFFSKKYEKEYVNMIVALDGISPIKSDDI